MAYNSTPTEILQFIFGIDIPTDVADTYTNYTDVTTNWDTDIAPLPPSMALYDESKVRIDNRVDLYLILRDIIYANHVKHGIYTSYPILGLSSIQYWLNYAFSGNRYNFWIVHLLYPYDVAKSVVGMGYQSSSEVTTGVMTYIDNTQITTLLEDYNIYRDDELFLIGSEYLATIIPVTAEEAAQDLNTLYEFISGETSHIGTQNTNSGIDFYSYDFITNTVFNNVDIKIDIDTAKSYSASWYPLSDNAHIVLGDFIIPEDGYYEIEFDGILNEDSDPIADRVADILLKINVIDEYIIDSKFYPTYYKQDMKLKGSITIPLESGDAISFWARGFSGNFSDPTNIGLNIQEGFVTIKKL